MSLVISRVGFCRLCRLNGRDFSTTLPSRVESPVCHRCTMRLLYHRRRPVPPHAAQLTVEARGLAATGHDSEARPNIRIFALSALVDRGQAADEDREALRALLLADATTEQATGGHGAALSGPQASGAAPDAPVNRERGRRRSREEEPE